MEHRTHDIDYVARRHTGDEIAEVTVDDPVTRNTTLLRVIDALYFVFGIIGIVVAIRFVLRLLGANPESSFVSGIYGLSAPLVAPFVGIFGTPQFGGSVVEPHSLVALIMYPLLGWLIAKLLWLVLADTSPRVATATRTERSEHEHEHDLAA